MVLKKTKTNLTKDHAMHVILSILDHAQLLTEVSILLTECPTAVKHHVTKCYEKDREWNI